MYIADIKPQAHNYTHALVLARVNSNDYNFSFTLGIRLFMQNVRKCDCME